MTEEEKTLGQKLLDAGWHQGVLFVAPGIQYGFNSLDGDGNIKFELAEVKPEEKLLLISQDCDIKSKDELLVDALICQIEDKGKVGSMKLNSARSFVVDKSKQLVVKAFHKVQIEKSVLFKYAPEPWTSERVILTNFRRWLDKRYTRPAIPDEIVEIFCVPLKEIFDRLKKDKENEHLYKLFNNTFTEIRLVLPEENLVPYKIGLVFLAEEGHESTTKEEEKALDYVYGEIYKHFSQISQVELTDGEYVSADTPETYPLSDYFKTTPFELDDLSYKGGNITGAEPYTLD